jgi:hypothetical protein
MGLVNSPSFPTAGATAEPPVVKKSKAKAVAALLEVPEECCALDCDNCAFVEDVTND